MEIAERLQKLKERTHDAACCWKAAAAKSVDGFPLSQATEEGTENFLVQHAELQFIDSLISQVRNASCELAEYLESRQVKIGGNLSILDDALNDLGLKFFKLLPNAATLPIWIELKITENRLTMIEVCLKRLTELQTN